MRAHRTNERVEIPLTQFDLMHNYHASETHDQIYAFKDIMAIPDQFQQHFEIDYSLSVEKVFAEAVRGIVKSTGDLAIMSLAPKLRSTKWSSPSWVPDFSNRTAAVAEAEAWTNRRPEAVVRPNKRNACLGVKALVAEDTAYNGLCVRGMH